MPTQYRQTIPAKQRGQKRQRTGARFRRIGPVPGIRSQPKGNYHAPVPLVLDSRPPLTPKPLSSAGWKLLTEFYRRLIFFKAVSDGLSPEDAGELIGVARTAAYQLRSELQRHGSPVRWFSAQAIAAIRRGEIAPGRAMKPSKRANAFFMGLGYGNDGKYAWWSKLGGRTRIDLADLDRVRDELGPGLSEAFDYWIHNGLLWEDE